MERIIKKVKSLIYKLLEATGLDYLIILFRKIGILPQDAYLIFIGTNTEFRRVLICCRLNRKRMEGHIHFNSISEFKVNFDKLNIPNKNDICVLMEYVPEIYKLIGQLHDFGIDGRKIHYVFNRKVKTDKDMDAYDVMLGFTQMHNDGIVILGNLENAKYRILVLGNSTSHVGFCNEKSWPEFLYEKYQRMKMDVALICTGMFFNNSWQELLRLERDGLYFNPDLVISYSGVCNIDVNYEEYLNEKNPYVWNYQAELVRKLVKEKKVKCTLSGGHEIRNVSVGVEKKSFSYAKWWGDTMRMMNGICAAFDIPFIGILQPNIFVGNPILYGNEHTGRVTSEYVERLHSWYTEAKEYIEQLNYMYDFTDIFYGMDNIYWDTCHVYEKGNRVIADRIFDKVSVFIE